MRELGLSEQALRDWMKRAAIEAEHGPLAVLMMAKREELIRSRPAIPRHRLQTQVAMHEAVAAWAERRNMSIHMIDWQFTTEDARATLRRLYPAFDAWQSTRLVQRGRD